MGKLKKRLITRTTDKSWPASVVERKSSSVWTRSSLKAHVRKRRSRWQLRCHARVSEKHGQSKSLGKRGARSPASTSSSITESITSDQSVGSVVTAVEEITSNVTKDERNIGTVTSSACVNNGQATDEKVTGDFCTSETVISDECVNDTGAVGEAIRSTVISDECVNDTGAVGEAIRSTVISDECVNDSGAVGEAIRSTVAGECRESETVMSLSVECVGNATAAREEVGLNLTEEKNCSHEPLASPSSSSPSSSAAAGAASVATETGDVLSVPSVAVSLSTHDVMVSLTNCFKLIVLTSILQHQD